jgi:predicted GNAT family acetyltransferase
MASELTLANDPDEHRYEAVMDGSVVGFAAYDLAPGRIVFTHTEVDEAHEGQGIASRLARYALDDVAAEGTRRVVALCPYIKAWIARHPEYERLQR